MAHASVHEADFNLEFPVHEQNITDGARLRLHISNKSVLQYQPTEKKTTGITSNILQAK
jgi:hypothetical protein